MSRYYLYALYTGSALLLVLIGIIVLTKGNTAVPSISGSPTLSFGQTALSLEIADTEAERVQGLSGRESLPENTGLLFVYTEDSFPGIWMKDMRFPIDIAWLDKDFTLIDLEANVDPATYPRVFTPSQPARYVLETPAGFFEHNAISIGAKGMFMNGAKGL
jgi:uncharacterized protein